MSEKLQKVIAEVIGIPVESVNDDSSPDSLPQWDSIAHLNLIMAIEDAFDIQLAPEETLELNSVKLIRLYLEEKGQM